MIRAMLALTCLLLAGCSTFDADYKALAEKPLPQGAFVDGVWDGTWESQKGFGSGRLQALIVRDDANLTAMQRTMATGDYNARFKATWSGVITSEYSVPIKATTDLTKVQTVTLHCEHDLGAAAGHYIMDGDATPTSFTAKYKADHDEGVIELHRPHAREGK